MKKQVLYQFCTFYVSIFSKENVVAPSPSRAVSVAQALYVCWELQGDLAAPVLLKEAPVLEARFV